MAAVDTSMLSSVILFLSVLTACQTDTESDEIRYMSMRARLHALPSAPESASHRFGFADAAAFPGRVGRPPRKKNLKTERLLKKLGKHYNRHLMSITNPHSGKRAPEVETKYTLDTSLLGELRMLNLSEYIDANKDELVRKPDIQKVMEKWLLQRASCPIEFTWEDLGSYFWPRWVRRGNCGTNRPCSWPPGMHCVPAESQTIFLLRWSCRLTSYKKSEGKRRNDKKQNQRSRRDLQNYRSHLRIDLPSNRWHKNNRGPKDGVKCRWKKVPYPVTAECFCSC